jgi:predicted metal-dependent HD superfamily phosphohydrolase
MSTPELVGKVKDHWNKLIQKYCQDTSLNDRFFEEIEKKYTGRNRHYHNLHHIEALLQLCEQYNDHLADKEVVALAVFYHDIIYNVLRKDNEPRSALLAVKRLYALGVPEDKTAQVKLFIEATQTHTITGTVVNKHDLQLFLDFDMSTLGAGWNDYLEYTKQVRREYRVYPDKLYIPGRTKFLEHCLQTEFIFQTAEFRENYEAAARVNMARELESMK